MIQPPPARFDAGSAYWCTSTVCVRGSEKGGGASLSAFNRLAVGGVASSASVCWCTAAASAVPGAPMDDSVCFL